MKENIKKYHLEKQLETEHFKFYANEKDKDYLEGLEGAAYDLGQKNGYVYS